MTTGLLIRDFNKQNRELRYANQGSIRFSEIEHNAYRLSLTLEITHIDAPRYGNKKTLPDNTHYGYCTLFKGSTVTDSISIKYPKFRVFDVINNGIWQYHQHTESLQLLAGGVQELVNEQSSYFVATPGFVTFDTCKTLRFLFPPGADPVADLVLRLADCGDALAGDGERDLASGYRAFPLASPFPDVVKFKGDIPLSFLWRLEMWYLVNPAVYIADNPTDTSDQTEDEDEYPGPQEGDGDGDGSEFPDSSEPDSGSDPRDYGGGPDIPPPPFTGGQCLDVNYTVTVRRFATISPAGESFSTVDLIGPIKGIRTASSVLGDDVLRQYWIRHGEPEQEYNLGGLFVTINGESNNPSFTIETVVRGDGGLDNCGDPPPIM